ncbi:oxidoreductase [Euzebya tangerina]|uniref:oxidoreductase n=1 Tax=Euzebya tangerina TaxID=591198 RepID=UPI00196AC260|nr:oxidoreductase [Euzebya tangerina]
MAEMTWTLADIPDQTGRVAVVTGANSGIGLITARELAIKGAHVVMGCRNLTKGESAVADIRAEAPSAALELVQLDLASLDSVRAFAAEVKGRHNRLDVLVNNAGIMMVPEGTTQDGFELQFGVNHLGHFALTGLLFDLLAETDGSRVVTVSSSAHAWGTFDAEDPMFQTSPYDKREAYGRSKLANLLFTYELQRRVEQAGLDGPAALAAHPGVAATNLGDHMLRGWYAKPVKLLMNVVFPSAVQGALPTLRAAVDPDAEAGEYYGPDGFQEARGKPVVVRSNRASRDETDARKLWEISEELTGVRFRGLEG